MCPAPNTGDGVRPEGNNAWGAWATLGLSLLAFVLLFIAQYFVYSLVIAGPAQPSRAPGIDAPALDATALLASLAVSAVLLTVWLALCIRWRAASAWRDYLAWHTVAWSQLLLWAALLWVALYGLEWLEYYLGRPQFSEFEVQLYHDVASLPLLFVALILLAPWTEELLFRGFMYRGLADSPLGVAGAIVLGAVLWAAIHVQYGPFDMAVIAVFGLFLGLARWHSRSLLAPMLLHALGNLFALVELYGEFGVID